MFQILCVVHLEYGVFYDTYYIELTRSVITWDCMHLQRRGPLKRCNVLKNVCIYVYIYIAASQLANQLAARQIDR